LARIKVDVLIVQVLFKTMAADLLKNYSLSSIQNTEHASFTCALTENLINKLLKMFLKLVVALFKILYQQILNVSKLYFKTEIQKIQHKANERIKHRLAVQVASRESNKSHIQAYQVLLELVSILSVVVGKFSTACR